MQGLCMQSSLMLVSWPDGRSSRSNYLLGLPIVPELCLTGRPDLAGHEGGRTAAVMMSGIAGAGWLSEASRLQR